MIYAAILWLIAIIMRGHCGQALHNGSMDMIKLEKIENGTIRQINAYYRANDESHKWPVCNKFNVTERAIRRLRACQYYTGGYEYFMALDGEISHIVNLEVM